MKQLLTILLTFMTIGVFASGGPNCVPDSSFTSTGISPDTLPDLTEGQFYDVTATVVIPTDTIVDPNLPPATINFFQLNGTGGLPAWVTVACEPPSCTFAGGSISCVRVSGTPPSGSAGMYPLEFFITLNVTATTPFGPQVLEFDDTISGFFLNVLPPAGVCTPDPNITGTGISPDTLPILNEGQLYDVTATVVIPTDTIVDPNLPPATINFFQLNGTGGLPSWVSFACEPPSCVFAGGTSNCVQITGMPPCGSAGNYPLEFYITLNVTATTPFGPQVLEFDDTISGFFLEVLPLPAPANVTSVEGCSNVTLSWDAVSGATGYEVKGGPVGNINAATLNLTGTSITVNNLAAACYEWYVRAKCGANTVGTWSERDTFCLPLTCGSPAPISSSLSGPNFNNVTLSWTPVAGAIGYQIQGGPGAMSTAVSLDVPGGAQSSLTVSNLACGGYSWRIRAVCCLTPFAASPYTAFDNFSACPSAKTDAANSFLAKEMDVNIHPNPANTQVKLVLSNMDENEAVNVSIFDMSGKVVYVNNYSVNNTFDQIDISTADFAKGIYQVVATNGATSVNERLIIAR